MLKATPVLALFLLYGVNTSHPYATQYSSECQKALEFYAANKSGFEQAAKNTHVSAAFMFAIVAPEITQFSYLGNIIETGSLKVLYVQSGASYSDFSVGFFQMKPSFIERMEDSLLKDTALQQQFKECLIDDPTSRAARVTRVKRLEQSGWQLKYLALFYALTEKRFSNKQFTTQEERLQFYASAYNCGFHKSASIIEATGEKALFPHFSSPKYKYSDISLWFYKSLTGKKVKGTRYKVKGKR